MPSAVFPVVRLPYDQPDRVARILDEVRCELKASRQQSATTTAAAPIVIGVGIEPSQWSSAVMTARVQKPQQQAQEPNRMTVAGTTTITARDAPTVMADSAAEYVDQTVEQVTVGVRDCTLTPKARPAILVTTGGVITRDFYRSEQHTVSSGVQSIHGQPYLLVPPVNITAEISRPPPTSLQQYTATS